MKKKILALCLVVALVATAITGVTLAYFTDTDEETNVFTMGGVTIDLEEKQFNEDGEVEEFEDDQELMPGKQNKLDKIVYIENTCENDVYVWYEWWIPAALDSVAGDTGLTNVLHVNSYGATWDKYVNGTYTYPDDFKGGDFLTPSATAAWDHDPEVELAIAPGPEGYIRQEEVDGITYNVYLVLFTDKVPAGKITPPAMNGVYLDMDLDMEVTENENGEKVTTYTCHGGVVDYDFSEGISIPVKAFGIQADGFDTVYDAYKAYIAEYPNV